MEWRRICEGAAMAHVVTVYSCSFVPEQLDVAAPVLEMGRMKEFFD
jgi:hypothetical protein